MNEETRQSYDGRVSLRRSSSNLFLLIARLACDAARLEQEPGPTFRLVDESFEQARRRHIVIPRRRLAHVRGKGLVVFH